jgi:transmembrane sensor
MMHLTEKRSWPGTASEWFAARHGLHDAELDRRFTRWLAEDPRNADEYALCDLTWALSADAAEGLELEAPSRHWYRRAPIVAAALAACAAIVGVMLYWTAAPEPLRFTTLPGEQRTVALEDGSRVTLNTRSALEVRLARSKREIRMLEGEAYFDVAKDPSRPFVVETPLGSARAVGTRFNVLIDTGRVEVSTEEGKVLVQSSDPSGSAVMATPGTRATLTHDGSSPVLAAADLTRIENWRAHRLEFDRVPLADALVEMSRYTVLPIRAGSADIGRVQVSAVLRAGDVDALRATLKGAFGLELVAGTNGWVVTGQPDPAAEPASQQR